MKETNTLNIKKLNESENLLDEHIDAEFPIDPPASDLELKQAQVWSKLEQLEKIVLRNKEQISLLEKGLSLGINLSDNHQTRKPHQYDMEEKSTEVRHTPSISPRHEHQPINTQNEVKISPPTTNNLQKLKENYSARLHIAQKLFNEGHFGKSYLEFSKLDREFENNLTHGEPKYWLGRCWYKLKEYHQAKQYYTLFLNQNPSSPWVPSALYHLAKTELEMGQKKAAIDRLSNLIKEHPYNGSSEAAKQILININQTL